MSDISEEIDPQRDYLSMIGNLDNVYETDSENIFDVFSSSDEEIEPIPSDRSSRYILFCLDVFMKICTYF